MFKKSSAYIVLGLLSLIAFGLLVSNCGSKADSGSGVSINVKSARI